ncbi:hypothetical protein A2U01_0032175, partial [Trifolium medium]|nr:hypothetical protein [Trifolium medium]
MGIVVVKLKQSTTLAPSPESKLLLEVERSCRGKGKTIK